MSIHLSNDPSFRSLAAALAFVTGFGLSQVQAGERVNIQFESGATSTTINGTVRGAEYVDYILNARGGQTMVVSLAVTGTNGNGSAFFNILPAGQDDGGPYTGSSDDDRRAEVTVPYDGDWAIRVYLMGNDRDTGKRVGYSIDVFIAATAAEGPLAGTNWQLVEIQSMDDATGTVRPEDPSRFTMQLNADGSVSMVLDCNRANGTWTAEPSADESNGRFEFGPLATTKALCPPPNLDESIAAQAQYIRGYMLKNGRLYLSLMADGGIYAWEPHEPEGEFAAGSSDSGAGEDATLLAAPEDGGYRNWRVTRPLNLRESQSTESPIVARLEPGKILDNMGCEVADGRVWCYVQPLGGGPVGFVAAEFVEPAVSPNGAAMTGPDNSAYRAGQGDFDARGPIRCAQEAGQPMTWCDFEVARAGGGYATVVVTLPDGRNRNLYFRMGIAIGAGTSEADNPGEFSMSREDDTTLIRLGEECYEIIDAMVLGG